VNFLIIGSELRQRNVKDRKENKVKQNEYNQEIPKESFKNKRKEERPRIREEKEGIEREENEREEKERRIREIEKREKEIEEREREIEEERE